MSGDRRQAGGALRGDRARERISLRWSDFVVDGLGIRCVDDHHWVTGAETCELVLTLDALGERESAVALFASMQHLRDPDGSYWTGLVYSDGKRWPEERTTWTAAAVVLLSAAQVQAAFYVDWYTIDGGGGTSKGAVYSVSGTIGQPDAGHMTGGNFTLDGGFWGIIGALQTPGAPLLSVFLTTTNTVLVAWPSASTGFSLQQNTNLLTTNWSNVTNAVDVVGTNNQVKIAPPIGNRYYRLFQ